MNQPATDLSALAPLQGVRVISMAQQLPGPYAGQLLGELGAEVILVEQTAGGDPARAIWPLFEAVNRGKRSIAMDLKEPAGREVVHRLVATARVVLEGFRPGVAGRLGIDYPTLVELRPDLIYCSISGYGQHGEDSLTPGHDVSYQARAAGLAPGAQSPEDGGFPVADLSAAMFAALSITSALLQTQSTYIDLSLADSALAWKAPQLQVAWQTGQLLNPDHTCPAYGLFATADGSVSLSVMHENHFWDALCTALGLPQLVGLGGAERARGASELREMLAAAIIPRTSDKLVEELVSAGVPAGRVNTADSVRKDAMFRQRGLIIGEPGHEQVRTPLSRLAAHTLRTAPALGWDTAALLNELGYSQRDIAELLEAGAAGGRTP